MTTLVPAIARTSDGNSGSLAHLIRHPELLRSARFLLTVSAAATDVGDTLDVYVQTTHDGGSTYDDVVHFTQVLGNGGAKKYLAEWIRDVSPESEMHAPQDAAMAAGVQQGGTLGTDLRVKWVIVDVGGDDASFTFGVEAECER